MSDSRKHIVADLGTLRALRERVREAKGGDSWLERDLCFALNTNALGSTYSIDDAVTLVERLAPDHWWRLRCEGAAPGTGRTMHGASLVGPESDTGFCYAATPALALIKALLSVLIARAEAGEAARAEAGEAGDA